MYILLEGGFCVYMFRVINDVISQNLHVRPTDLR